MLRMSRNPVAGLAELAGQRRLRFAIGCGTSSGRANRRREPRGRKPPRRQSGGRSTLDTARQVGCPARRPEPPSCRRRGSCPGAERSRRSWPVAELSPDPLHSTAVAMPGATACGAAAPRPGLLPARVACLSCPASGSWRTVRRSGLTARVRKVSRRCCLMPPFEAGALR